MFMTSDIILSKNAVPPRFSRCPGALPMENHQVRLQNGKTTLLAEQVVTQVAKAHRDDFESLLEGLGL